MTYMPVSVGTVLGGRVGMISDCCSKLGYGRNDRGRRGRRREEGRKGRTKTKRGG